MVSFVLKCGGTVLICGIASEILYQLYIRYTSRKEKKRRLPKTAILFFPDQTVACKAYFTEDYGCENSNCRFSHEENSLSKLFTCINSAKNSIDVCVFVITCGDLADLLIRAHKKGISVRVITDNEQVDVPGSKIWKLRKEGVPVRIDNSSFYMHHKFALIDKKQLINGSFNWTQTAITGNHENILISNDEHIITPYTTEFEKLWLEFNPKKD